MKCLWVWEKGEGWWKWGVSVVVVGDGGCRTRHITVLKWCADLEVCRMGWRHKMGGNCEDSTASVKKGLTGPGMGVFIAFVYPLLLVERDPTMPLAAPQNDDDDDERGCQVRKRRRGGGEQGQASKLSRLFFC